MSDQLPFVQPRNDLLDGLVGVLVLDDLASGLGGGIVEVAALHARPVPAHERGVYPDVAATGYALAQALATESPDLVLLGQQSDDGECYTIGAEVADHLQMPSLTQVIKMDV